MNRCFLFLWVWAASCACAIAQTNSLTNAFLLPKQEKELKLDLTLEESTNALSLFVPDLTPKMIDFPPSALTNEAAKPSSPSASMGGAPSSQISAPRSFVFPLPEPQWLKLPGEYQMATNAPALAQGDDTVLRSPSWDAARTALFGRIEREGLLKPLRPAEDGEFDRVLRKLYRPEYLNYGFTERSTSPTITTPDGPDPWDPGYLLDPLFPSFSHN